LEAAYATTFGVTGNTLRDLTSGKHHGTLTSISSPEGWVSSRYGPVIRTGTAGDNIATDLYLPGTGPLSVTCLFRTTTADTTNALLWWGAVSAAQQYQLLIENGVIWNRFAANTVSAGSGYNDGLWHIVTNTKPDSAIPSGVKMYADGVELSTADTGSDTLDFSSANPLRLSCGQATSTYQFIGDIALWLIHTRVINDSEIALLHSDPFVQFRLKPRIIALAGEAPPPVTWERLARFRTYTPGIRVIG
jgi:hypothetical protein